MTSLPPRGHEILTPLELQVVALASREDRRRAQHQSSRLARAIYWLAGARRVGALADPRLEALRIAVHLLRAGPDREWSASILLRNAGYSDRQISFITLLSGITDAADAAR